MSSAPTLALAELVSLAGERPVTTSRRIAQCFNKNHQHVMRDIRNLIKRDPDWSVSNFGQSDYVNARGKTYQEYTVTKDGFMILAMGFTGEDAFRWKLAFMNAFNQMAERLNDLSRFAQMQQIICQDKESLAQASTGSAVLHRRKRLLRYLNVAQLALELQIQLDLELQGLAA